MCDGKNSNVRNETPRKNGTPEKGSEVLPKDVSWLVTRALESGMGTVSAAFESALERVVKTWGKYRRLWLVRHFDYEDSKEARDYVEASKEDKSRMKPERLIEINEMSKKVRANVDDPFIQRIILGSLRKRPDETKAVLYLDIEESIATRNRMTYEWVDSSEELKDWFVTKRFKITTEKVDDTGEKTFRAFSEIGGIMNDWLRDEDRGDGVIFGNRTPSHAFWLRVWRPCYSEKDHTDQMERLGYDFWDVEKATGKPILIQNGKTLRVTLENLAGIEAAILGACDGADRKKKASIAFANLPLIMLQEAVNDMLGALRTSKPDEYLSVLRFLSEWKGAEGKHDPELQSYVFERLMENGFPWEALLRSEWSTGALEWMATKGYREMVIRYFWESEEGPVDNLGPFAKSINVKGMKELFADAYEYWKIRQKQKRSVDPAIREWKEGAILPRSFEIRQNGQKTKWPFGKFERIFHVLANRPIIVEWTVGSWKSTWLGEFAKYAILRWMEVKRFDAESFPLEKAEGESWFLSWIKEWKTLLFIDGFDEIKLDEKKRRLYRFILKTWGMAIIGSRPGEFEPFDNEFAFLRLGPLDWKEFAKAYDVEKEETEAVSEFLSSKFLSNEIGWNPLMLSMLRNIVTSDAEEAEKFRNWRIPRLEEIQSKFELYEAFCRFVLASHAENSKGVLVTRRILDGLLADLWRYAHDSRNGTVTDLPEEDIRGYANILQKDGDGYAFAHASLEEFFLMREMLQWKGFAEHLRESKECFAELIERDAEQTAFRQHWAHHEEGLVRKCYRHFSETRDHGKLLEFTQTLSSDEFDEGGGVGFFLAMDGLLRCMEKDSAAHHEHALETLLNKAEEWTPMERFEKMRMMRSFLRNGKIPVSVKSRVSETLILPIIELAREVGNSDGNNLEIARLTDWFENDGYSKREFAKTSLLRGIESFYADLAHTGTEESTIECLRIIRGEVGRIRFGGFCKIVIFGTLCANDPRRAFEWISKLDVEDLRLCAFAVSQYQPDLFERTIGLLLDRTPAKSSDAIRLEWMVEYLAEKLPIQCAVSGETMDMARELGGSVGLDDEKTEYLWGLDRVAKALMSNRRLQYGN